MDPMNRIQVIAETFISITRRKFTLLENSYKHILRDRSVKRCRGVHVFGEFGPPYRGGEFGLPPPRDTRNNADDTRNNADVTRNSADDTRNNADDTRNNADVTRNSADDTRNNADDTRTTCRRHITREFGLKSRKKMGGGENREKNLGEATVTFYFFGLTVAFLSKLLNFGNKNSRKETGKLNENFF